MSGIERDRELDAAWRAASREEPPAALDDAVRAEARRAVGAAPGARPRHAWRYPAAAAATVALLAFGIAQMTSRERIEPVVVADQAAVPQERAAKPESAPAERFAPAPHPPARSEAENAPPPARHDTDAEAPQREKAAPAAAAVGEIKRRTVASSSASAKVTGLDELKAKEAGAGSLAAWIERIRALRQSGDLAAAARELGRFRDAYGDRADALLPSDLRGGAGSDAKAQ